MKIEFEFPKNVDVVSIDIVDGNRLRVSLKKHVGNTFLLSHFVSKYTVLYDNDIRKQNVKFQKEIKKEQEFQNKAKNK